MVVLFEESTIVKASMVVLRKFSTIVGQTMVVLSKKQANNLNFNPDYLPIFV